MICYFDGSYANGSGKRVVGIGFSIPEKGVMVHEDVDVPSGIEPSSNWAEYTALSKLLSYIKEHFPDERAIILGDSALVINQVSGKWKVKSDNIRQVYLEVMPKTTGCTFKWIPREKNLADGVSRC